MSDIGLDNYRRLWSDPGVSGRALDHSVRFVTISVAAIETVLGFALALFCAKGTFAGIRLLRTVLIVPMVIAPVVVAIVFRLISTPTTPAC